MSYATIFVGTPDATGILPDAVRVDIARALRVFAGKPVSIQIRRYVPKRTNPQNAYLHVSPFPILAAFFGQSIEETKRDLMGECWGWTVNAKTGWHTPVRAHTSEMDVEEATFFIDWLLPWAMEKWQVYIPLPTEVQRRGDGRVA